MMTRDMKKQSPQTLKELKDLNFTAYVTCGDNNECGHKVFMENAIKEEERYNLPCHNT